MPRDTERIRKLIARFGLPQPIAVRALGGAGGFSGAEFWYFESAPSSQVTSGLDISSGPTGASAAAASPKGPGAWCLRRWPKESPDEKRLAWMHAVLSFVGRQLTVNGSPVLPEPVADSQGRTFVRDSDRRLWEATPWMRGEAEDADIAQSPTSLYIRRTRAALALLARFHTLAADFPGNPVDTGISPGLQMRVAGLRSLASSSGPATTLRPTPYPSGRLQSLALHWLKIAPGTARALLPRISPLAEQPRTRQICIRDVWRDHVLFAPESDTITGLVDFGAMRVDWPAGDVARLLGSFAGDVDKLWSEGREAYEQHCPFSDSDWQAVRAFDASSVVLSGWNWLKWIYEEGRHFEDLAAVEDRFERLLGRLERLRE